MMKMIFLLLCVCLFVSSSEGSSYFNRDVSFQNGPVRLSGTLLIPSTKGSSPVVIFLQGSGCMPRTMLRPIAEQFAGIGVASLIFDKRGCGNSTGSWINSSLDDLAQDAIAAVKFCKTQKNIDRTRIGFWAVSQSGWVAPLAISRTSDVSFLIVVSGGGARPEQAERFAYRKALEQNGFSENDQKEATQLLDLYFDYLRAGKNRNALIKGIEESRAKPWYSQVQLDKILPSEQGRRKWQWVATFDPEPYEEKLRCPVLLFFGGKDIFQPASDAAKSWEHALQKGNNLNYTIKFFPEAGHAMSLGPHHMGNQTYVDGYLQTMLQWLKENVSAKIKE